MINSPVLNIIKWYTYIIKKFIQQKKQCTTFIIFSSILLQVLQLASFIVPLKMLFHLTSTKAFSYSLGGVIVDTKSELSVIMILVLAVLLTLMIMIEKVSYKLKYKCSQDIWKNSKKLHVYHNQEQMATNIYTQMTNGMSGFVFTLVVLCGLLYLYKDLALVLFTYWLLSFWFITQFLSRGKKFQKKLETELNKVVATVSLIGFLTIFIYIVLDFLSSNPSTTISHAVIALILVRHVSGSVSQFIMSIKNLFNQRVQIETIFFQEHQSLLTHSHKDTFLNLIEEKEYTEWIPSILKEILDDDFKCVTYEWYELAIANEIAFRTVIQKNDEEKTQVAYLLKVFNKNFHAKAVNEATLYAECKMDDISPRFVGASIVEDFQCHVFEFDGYTQITQQDFPLKRLEILEKINQFSISDDFIMQYRQTNKLVYERFTPEILSYVGSIAQGDEKELIHWFENNFEKITEELNKLPLRLVTPTITGNTLLETQQKELQIVSFNNWSIEPLGFGFMSIPEKELLKKITTEEEYRKALMVHYLRVCEQSYNANKFNAVLQNIAAIKDIYETSCEKVYERSEDIFRTLTEVDKSKKLIQDVLQKTLGYDFRYIKHSWFELGVPNIISFNVIAENKNVAGIQKSYLIKVYNKNFYTQAMNEATLYLEVISGDMSPKFIGSTLIDEMQCHVFCFDGYIQIAKEEFATKRLEMLEKINKYKIAQNFIQDYRATHKLIYERFSYSMVNNLKVIQGEDAQELVSWFATNFENIIQDIQTLPLRIVSQGVNNLNSLVVDASDEVKSINFLNWSIEPLGFSFMSIPEKELLKQITEKDEYKKALMVHYLRLCEQNYNANKFMEVIQNFERIKELYE